MAVEVIVALIAAVRSRGVVLAAFGVDSGIELFSAATVLWRFRSTRSEPEAAASKITGWLLIALAFFIVGQSLYTLLGGGPEPRSSYLGMALLITAAIVMPSLGRRKRQLSIISSSSSLRADAAQSSICAYMSWIALAGLLLNSVVHIPWADPVAAIGLLPFVLKEANESFKGHSCHDCLSTG
jgi:divalent metal cation (Fe/Co/Zn/Cd) transporter